MFVYQTFGDKPNHYYAFWKFRIAGLQYGFDSNRIVIEPELLCKLLNRGAIFKILDLLCDSGFNALQRVGLPVYWLKSEMSGKRNCYVAHLSLG